MTFDVVDQHILSILRADGRASHAAVAKAVGLSAPAVGERVRKLEQGGVIRSYRAVFDPDALGLPICAFVAIIPQPRNPCGEPRRAPRQLCPRSRSCTRSRGDYSYVAKVRVGSTQDLDAFLDRLVVLDGVERTQTTMVLRTSLERPMHLPFAPAPDPTTLE